MKVGDNAYTVYREEKHVTDVQPVSRIVKKKTSEEKWNAGNGNGHKGSRKPPIH